MDSLPITVTTVATGVRRRWPGPSEAELRKIVRRVLGGSYLIVDRMPAEDYVMVQIWRDEAGPYAVDLFDGSADRHFFMWAHNPELLTDLMVDWAQGGSSWFVDHDMQLLEPSLEQPQ